MKAAKRKVSKLQRRNDILGYAFLAPNLIGFIAFTLIPFVYALYISFFKWDGITESVFVGLNNYTALLKDSGFRIAMKNTLVYTVLNVSTTIVAGLVLALAVHSISRLKTLFRTTLFLPNMVTISSIVIVWQAFYHPTYSPFSMILRGLGVENPPQWIGDPKWAMLCIIVMSIWLNAGYYMVLFLAALNNIAPHYYEAADIDGASAWAKFWRITLPMLSPTMFFVVIMAIINSFKVFDQVALLTQGGPGRSTNVLVYYIYQESFTYYRFGSASAMAYVLFALIFVVTVIQYRGQSKWVVQ